MKRGLSQAYVIFGGFQVALGAAVALYGSSWEYHTALGPGPGFFPFWTGVLLAGFGLILGAVNAISLKRTRGAHDPHEEPLFTAAKLKNIAAVIGSLGMCIVLLKLAGFVIAIGLFSLFLLQIIGKWGWVKSAALAGILVAPCVRAR